MTQANKIEETKVAEINSIDEFNSMNMEDLKKLTKSDLVNLVQRIQDLTMTDLNSTTESMKEKIYEAIKQNGPITLNEIQQLSGCQSINSVSSYLSYLKKDSQFSKTNEAGKGKWLAKYEDDPVVKFDKKFMVKSVLLEQLDK